jgi:hypothetical protein
MPWNKIAISQVGKDYDLLLLLKDPEELLGDNITRLRTLVVL